MRKGERRQERKRARWHAHFLAKKRGGSKSVKEAGAELRVNPPFSSVLFFFAERERERERPLGRLSFDHICILVMKFARGPVISVYLTDSLTRSVLELLLAVLNRSFVAAVVAASY